MAAQTAEDKKYQAKSTHHMFLSALYGGLGGAAFFGVLMNVVQMGLKAFAVNTATTATAATTATTAAAGFLGLSLGGWGIIAGLMVAGVACTYLSQIEATKLREVQDDRLAKKNAEMLTCQGKEKALSRNVEYPQNCRHDGNTWETVTQAAAKAEARVRG